MAEGGLGFDANRDVRENGDEGFHLTPLVANRLDFQMQMVFPAGLGVVDDVGTDPDAARHGGPNVANGAAIGIGTGKERLGTLAFDFLEIELHHPSEALVDPLDQAERRGDDHQIVCSRGHEGQFASGRLRFFQRLFGQLPVGDILQGSDDTERGPAGSSGHRFGAGVDPTPFAVTRSKSVFRGDERFVSGNLFFDG